MHAWAQKLNYIKNLKLPQKILFGLGWENLSLLGTPDLLGYNNHWHFFTVELKVASGNKGSPVPSPSIVSCYAP